MDPRDLVVTKNVYFSLLIHTNQLLLMTLCHTPAGIRNSEVGRDGRRTDAAVRTGRRESRNSYVDFEIKVKDHFRHLADAQVSKMVFDFDFKIDSLKLGSKGIFAD